MVSAAPDALVRAWPVEFKYCNISAAMIDLGFPYIEQA